MCRYVIELNRKSTCQISHLSVAGDQGVASEAVHAAADGAVVPHLAGIRLYYLSWHKIDTDKCRSMISNGRKQITCLIFKNKE